MSSSSHSSGQGYDAGVSPRTPVLSPAEAERAIYVDFEGTKVDPPSLLGALRAGGGGAVHFTQYVLEEGLWPAAEASTGIGGGLCRPATWADLAEVRRIAEAEHRRPRHGGGGSSPAPISGPGPTNRMRGRHQLHQYLTCIGYSVPPAFGPGNSAKRIRDVRDMLAARHGDYAALTPTAKGKWTRGLQHNWHDCNGLREWCFAVPLT